MPLPRCVLDFKLLFIKVQWYIFQFSKDCHKLKLDLLEVRGHKEEKLGRAFTYTEQTIRPAPRDAVVLYQGEAPGSWRTPSTSRTRGRTTTPLPPSPWTSSPPWLPHPPGWSTVVKFAFLSGFHELTIMPNSIRARIDCSARVGLAGCGLAGGFPCNSVGWIWPPPLVHVLKRLG